MKSLLVIILTIRHNGCVKKINLKTIQALIPERHTHGNKTDAGHVMIIGGHKGYLGAGILGCLGATRMGAGYTHVMHDQKHYPWVKFPDFIVHPQKISELKEKENFSFGVGSGLGVNAFTKKIILALIKMKADKVVLDADALTVLSQLSLTKLPTNWILTPHEGELARLLHCTSHEVKKDRECALKKAHKKFACHILLKGAETLLIDGAGNITLVSEGNKALSKAGMGDVLTGMIAALLAQGLNPLHAMSVGAFLHGRTSKDYLKLGFDHLSMRPVDVVELLPESLKKMRS